MSRVTSLTSMPEAQLNRWIKRIGLLLLVGVVAFVAFYAVDRFRAPVAPIIDQQLSALEDAVRKDPTDVASRGQLADLYFAKRRFDDAIAQYTALIDANKNVELASLGRGNAYRELQKWPEATKDYQKVVEIGATGEMANVDPSLEGAFYGLGMIALAESKPADAIDQLQKALAITRTDADALNALGLAYTKTDQPDKAIQALGLAVSLVPVGWADPYQNMALAYTKLDKANLAAWANAMAALESGDPTGAEAQLRKLIDTDAAANATLGLGILYEMAGDSGTAATWYAKSLAVDPTNEAAQLGIKRVSGGASMSSASPDASPSAAASAAPSPTPAGSN